MEAVQHLRDNSFGRLLFKASRAYSEAAMARVRAAGHPDLTIAHASILPHIDIAGSRLTTISERAGMTKQSASELVSGLEKKGYVERKPDPADKRAQLVAFTAKGENFLLSAFAAKTALEQNLIDRLGVNRAELLTRLLREYVDGLKDA
ncbi:MAG TPA: MarR family winged helix-turn-helix transcriptional regulator [Myxococcaceae bacterium]|nr:MarR family winged helix-turn-helix transcriptional regulator [Myxococcaceae bacterium]